MNSLRKILTFRSSNTLWVFIALVVVFSLFTPNRIFINVRNISAIGKLFPDLGIITLGVGMLMVCGEFDLSVAAVLPFCSYVFARLLFIGTSPLISFIVAIITGMALGYLNGFITVKTRMPSFITTLGTLWFWRGILYVWSKMMPMSIRTYVPNNTPFQLAMAGNLTPFFPIQVLWFLIFAVILGIILHYHRFGNWVFATGDNRDAARAMGIKTDMVKIVCYVIVGALCGFCACMQAVRLGSFAATQGVNFEFKAVAACVVGGTSLRGGIGSMLGIVLGALIIPIIDNGLILMRVPVFAISAFIGLATILFVLLNTYIERKMR